LDIFYIYYFICSYKVVIMKKTKIAHIAHSVGGVDVYLRLVIGNINSNRFSNIVIHGTNDANTSFLDNEGRPVNSFKAPIFRNISIINDLKSVFECYKVLKKERPDIIHAHSAKGGIIGRLVGKLLNIKVLFTPHAFSYLSAENNFKRYAFVLIEKIFANSNSILLATSNSERLRGLNEVGYIKEKAIVFNNCIAPITDVKTISIEQTWPDKYICTVGRPCYQKNIDFMIQVFHEIRKSKDIHLVIMGVGHHVGQLDIVKKTIKDLNLSSHVTLLSWTSREDVLSIISKSQLYISTARYEGMPYSIIESLALSIPCVVSDCDGNRDLIQDGFNGYVVKSNDIMEFKDCALKILDDEALKKQFSENALKSFSENFNIVNNISKLENIYTKYANRI